MALDSITRCGELVTWVSCWCELSSCGSVQIGIRYGMVGSFFFFSFSFIFSIRDFSLAVWLSIKFGR